MGLKIGVDGTALVAKPTGVGNYIRSLLDSICRLHHEATFIIFSNDEVDFPLCSNVITRVSRPKRRGPYWQNTHLCEMLREERPQIFWASNGLLPAWGLRDTATILTVHDLVYKFAPDTLPFMSRWGRSIGQRMAVASADKVIYVSEATAADAVRTYGRVGDAVISPVVHKSFERPLGSTISDMRARLKLPERYLLVLGTLEPRKNLVALIDAYLNRRQLGVNLPLLAIAGGKGWLDIDITARIENGENLGIIRRLGYVDSLDLPSLYAGSEAFLMPSLYEGFGMPLLEAQMCGAPVIHGSHASMEEAAGGLGVLTATDVSSIEAILDQLAEGTLPLACRLRSDIRNDADISAEKLWKVFIDAAESKGHKLA